MKFHLDRAALPAALFFAASLIGAPANAQCETDALTGSRGTLGFSQLDSCVLLQGDELFVAGANAETYVFSRTGSVWTETAVLPHWGGSIARDAGTLVIGDYFHQLGTGRVPVYVGSGSTWTLQQTLTSTAPGPFREFGGAVAISGDTLVIGQPGFGDLEESNGDAHVFVRSAGTWSLQQILTPSDQVPSEVDHFGTSIAIEGDRIVVGASQGYDLPSPGAVYVYERSGTTWTEVALLTSPAPADKARFGHALALDGATLAVAESGWSAFSVPPAAYVFVESGGAWSLQATLPVAGATSIALQGDRCVVGAQNDIAGGSVSFFERSGTSWTQTKKLYGSPGTGSFGNSVSLDVLSAAVLAYGALPDQLFLVNVDPSGCPGADFEGSPTSGVAPLTVDFMDRSSGSVTSWSWDFGDGVTSDLRDPSHLYDVGRYTVSLLVEGPGGRERDAEPGYVEALLSASATIRNGSGVNGLFLTSLTLPVIGTQWDLDLDHSSHAGANLTLVRGHLAPLAGSPTPFGELLIDVTTERLVHSAQVSSGTSDLHSFPVPVDVAFVGIQGFFQGVILDGGLELTNAVDAVVGF